MRQFWSCLNIGSGAQEVTVPPHHQKLTETSQRTSPTNTDHSGYPRTAKTRHAGGMFSLLAAFFLAVAPFLAAAAACEIGDMKSVSISYAFGHPELTFGVFFFFSLGSSPLSLRFLFFGTPSDPASLPPSGRVASFFEGGVNGRGGDDCRASGVPGRTTGAISFQSGGGGVSSSSCPSGGSCSGSRLAAKMVVLMILHS